MSKMPGKTINPTVFRRLAESLLNLLSHPLIRRALYYLLWVCLIIEEYLTRILLEE